MYPSYMYMYSHFTVIKIDNWVWDKLLQPQVKFP